MNNEAICTCGMWKTWHQWVDRQGYHQELACGQCEATGPLEDTPAMREDVAAYQATNRPSQNFLGSPEASVVECDHRWKLDTHYTGMYRDRKQTCVKCGKVYVDYEERYG